MNWRISERERALIIAATVLGRPNADPDDDIAVLARQLNRAIEALQTIALLETGPKVVFRNYQKAIQTARIALGLAVK